MIPMNNYKQVFKKVSHKENCIFNSNSLYLHLILKVLIVGKHYYSNAINLVELEFNIRKMNNGVCNKPLLYKWLKKLGEMDYIEFSKLHNTAVCISRTYQHILTTPVIEKWLEDIDLYLHKNHSVRKIDTPTKSPINRNLTDRASLSSAGKTAEKERIGITSKGIDTSGKPLPTGAHLARRVSTNDCLPEDKPAKWIPDSDYERFERLRGQFYDKGVENKVEVIKRNTLGQEKPARNSLRYKE